MTMINKIALAGAALGSIALTCGTATGAEYEVNQQGWYGSLEAGSSTPQKSGFILNANSFFPGTGTNHSVSYDNGYGVLGGLGYKFDPNWRVEFELGYRRNGMRGVTPFPNVTGHSSGVSYMGNIVYDIDLAPRWIGYLGAGIGGFDFTFKNKSNGATILRNGDTTMAYQALVGVAYHIAQPTYVFIDYHYISALDGRISSAQFNQNPKVQYKDHLIGIGLRYFFDQPAPPPMAPAPAPVMAPAPAPMPAKPAYVAPAPKAFLVFFDFDQSTITPEARRIIESSVEWAKKGSVLRIGVTGHTDTMGSAEYNQALSMRRADAVRAELIRLGYTNGDVSVSGKGFSQPLVPTGPEVREPQNRRAEIVLQ